MTSNRAQASAPAVGSYVEPLHVRHLRQRRDLMRALKERGLLRHPMGDWAWRLAQAQCLGAMVDASLAFFRERSS